ncbi:hypothetical protein V2G26_018665 [Clonostachys chloroleuca]
MNHQTLVYVAIENRGLRRHRGIWQKLPGGIGARAEEVESLQEDFTIFLIVSEYGFVGLRRSRDRHIYIIIPSHTCVNHSVGSGCAVVRQNAILSSSFGMGG